MDESLPKLTDAEEELVRLVAEERLTTAGLDSMERTTVTGWALCPDDKAKHDEGYVALVEARAPESGDSMQPEEAYRLGRIAHVREAAFNELFNVSARNKDGELLPLVFIEPEAMDRVEEIAAAS